MRKPGDPSPTAHAVVIGSGMAGLAAAGVLARRFARVTIVERDPAPEEREPRKGVPQGRHAHILLMSGEEALEAVFPGVVAEMEARGSCHVNFGSELRWFHHGCWKVHYDSELVIHMQSRPFLESIIRKRLAALGNVVFRYRTAAAGLEIERGRVTAVQVRDAGVDGPGEPLAADLAVDASGRGSQLARWLEAHGYPAPREEHLGVDVLYASRIYRPRPSTERSWKALLVYHNPPVDRRVGLIFPIEGERWIVTLGGYLGDHAPTEEAGWLDFARNLSRPDLFEAIRDAEPLSDIQALRFPQARWTHFEEVSRFPTGLLPLGDTVCSFDPVFGQGMSISFREAQILGPYLDRDPTITNSRPFRRALAKLVGVPWLLTASEDLRYTPLAGRRPFWLPALQKYTAQVFRLAASRPADYDRLLRVLHLLNGPELLFHPKTLAGVLGRSLRPGEDRAPDVQYSAGR